MARRAALSAIGAAALAVAVLVLTAGPPQHQLRAVFTAALQVRPGQQIRIAGRTVGSVRGVSLWHGQALVTLGLQDSEWPVHAGTTAELRFGAAAAYASRYVQLEPGPPNTPALAENALLPQRDTVTPVEFDQLFSTFDASTRANFGGTLSEAAATLRGHAADLKQDLSLGGPGTQRTANMFGDLATDPAQLGTLVNAGADTAAALRARDAQLQGLTSNAARTFSVLADNATALQHTIAQLPATLAVSRATLAHLDRSLYGLGTLASDLAPGARGLLATAAPLRTLLSEIETVGPSAIATLSSGRRRLPLLTRFLTAARPFLPPLSRALTGLEPTLSCLRPYTPEIAGYIETWQGGAYDRFGHFGRSDLIETPVSPGTTLDSAQAVAQSHGSLHYAFPRPPGLNARQPWFQPQCGAGPDALDPAKDPEAGK